MSTRAEALSQIAALAKEHGIGLKDIAQAMDGSKPAKASGSIVSRLFAYLGGIFVFSGIAAYIGMFWGDMNSAMHVLITLGTGFILFLISASWARSGNYARAVAPLLLLAALLQPTGLFVAIHEYFNNGGDPHYAALLVFGVMLIQQAFTFQSLRHPVSLFAAIWFGCLFFGTAFDFLHVQERWISIIIGFSVLCVAYGMHRTPFRGMTGFWYLTGSMAFLWGAFDLLQHTPVEVLYLALTCFMVYVSVLTRSSALLIVSVLAMLGYISYFTEEHFLHSVGWPVALIILGIIFLGVSTGALKIKKKYFTA